MPVGGLAEGRGARPRGGGGASPDNLWAITHPAISIFAVAADVISQALMGLDFTLNHPHCPQQMTNTLLSQELRSCRRTVSRRVPPPTSLSFRPHQGGSQGPWAWGHSQLWGSPGGVWELKGGEGSGEEALVPPMLFGLDRVVPP